MSSSTVNDLYKSLTTDPEFCNKISKILSDIEKADKAGDITAVRHHVQELLFACEFNASLLVPYFFPKFPEAEPMSLWSRPHAFSMMALTLLGSMTIQASRQVGKCVEKSTVLQVKDSKGSERKISIEDLFEEAKLGVSSVTGR